MINNHGIGFTADRRIICRWMIWPSALTLALKPNNAPPPWRI
jgi:hypothetical protein